MPLRKIVVGVDFSAGGDVAARRALELAAQHGAEVVLVHAATVPEHPAVPASMQPTADALVDILAQRLAADRAELGALRERLQASGVTVSQLVVDRYPDDALVEAAAQLDADLIVTGSRHRTGVRRWLLGSVAEHVVRGAGCSVLVARPGDPDRGFERIVVGSDFSPAAVAALAQAVELARPGAALELVHCFQVPILSVGSDTDQPIAGYDALRTELLADAETRGTAALAVHADAGLTLSFRVVEASPREAVCDRAEELNADLVVVGNHGRRGLRRVLLGSVAEATVRHAPCSVLVTRAR